MSDVEVVSRSSSQRLDMAEMEVECQQYEIAENGEEQLEEPNEVVQTEQAQVEDEKEKRPAEEDRTEDQVPDITATENADQMTTSMDEIEELPASEETQAAESMDLLDAAPQVIEETIETVVEEERVGSAMQEIETTFADEKGPDEIGTQNESEIADEKVEMGVPGEDENKIVDEVESAPESRGEIVDETVATAEESEQHTSQFKTSVSEQAFEETKEYESVGADDAGELKEETFVEQHVSDEGTFELHAPPEPKRPRTPNELDNATLEEEVNQAADEDLYKDQKATEESHLELEQEQVSETAEENNVQEAALEAPTESVAESVKESVTALSRKISGSATPKRSVSSIPATPKSTTLQSPKEQVATGDNVTTTPRSVSLKDEDIAPSKQAFTFEQSPPETPKSATQNESVTTPATPQSVKTPKTPVTPKTPKTPKKDMEVVLPEAVPEVEPAQEDTLRCLEETEAMQAVADHEPASDVLEAKEGEIEKDQEGISWKGERKEVEEHLTEQAEEPLPPIAQEVTTEEIAPMDSTTVESEVGIKSNEKIETNEPLRETFTPLEKESRQETSKLINLMSERVPSPTRQSTVITHEKSSSHFDQDSFRSKGAPPRLPTNASFSSFTPVAKSTYSSLSPWVQNTVNKYSTDYSTTPTYRPTSLYLSQFDDMVKTGAFSNNLYSVNRLLERSRSRTRERNNALRSARSASNYNRYTSTYGATPIRTREYSSPPISAISKLPSRSSSFISFMQYSDAKNYEIARSRSRSYGFESPFRRSTSRANIEPFYETGRLSRVDSYVQNMDTRYEWTVPSTYAKYRSSSRSNLFQRHIPSEGYLAYKGPSSFGEANRYDRYSFYDTVPGMYESRIGNHGRSLSRERIGGLDRMTQSYTLNRSPTSNTLSRLYSGFTRDWIGI